MGDLRTLTLIALPIVFFVFGLTAGLFVTELQVREEHAFSIESPTGLLPYDRIQKEDVHVYADHVKLDISGARWAKFSPTGSMLPVLGTTAHALQIIPKSPNEIHEGDIVSFQHEQKIISHRVIATGEDDRGWYAITQGDNNPEPDPVLVRFSQIDRVVVAVLY